MKEMREKIAWLFDNLGFAFAPIGIMLADKIPEDALYFKRKGNGCIASLIFLASKGKTIAINKDSTGYPCSAFYLGYTDWIFDGVEYFLSHSSIPFGRECERFIKNPELAKEFVQSYVPYEFTDKTYVFKPIVAFADDEKPEAVIFFANPDQLSALVFLIHYSQPLNYNKVITGFASACMAMATIPLQYARKNENKAFWGLHDIAVRSSIPEDLMTLSMPFPMFKELCNSAPESFLGTANWQKLLARIKDSPPSKG